MRLEPIIVSPDSRHFICKHSGDEFVPLGLNYDHDENHRTLETYWLDEWDKVRFDLDAMKNMGANIVRIHLQTASFLNSPNATNHQTLDQLSKLIEEAAYQELYLNITGLCAYNKADQPGWYMATTRDERWEIHRAFWDAIARTTAGQNNIFCLNLMNEPLVPGKIRPAGAWLGRPFLDGKHYTQFIALDGTQCARVEIAREWTHMLTQTIRQHDQEHLLTLGLVEWSLDRPGMTSGFIPEHLIDLLDYISVHIYPQPGAILAAMDTLKAFCAGKPLVIEETAHLHCNEQELHEFLSLANRHACGLFSFYTDLFHTPDNDIQRKHNHDMGQIRDFFRKHSRSLFPPGRFSLANNH